MSREIMQQALHYLVDLADDLRRIPNDIAQTIAALEAEIAKPEQEPVAWRCTAPPCKCFDASYAKHCAYGYTAPPKRQWVGLTEDELKEIQYSTDTQVEYVTYDEGEYGTEIDIFPENFAYAIEAKLKEKNGGV